MEEQVDLSDFYSECNITTSKDDSESIELLNTLKKGSSFLGPYRLELLESIACACLMEEAASKLSILGCICDLPPVSLEPYQTLEERFGTPQTDNNIFDPETIEPCDVAMKKQKYIKFQKDILFAEKVLINTVKSLIKNNNYEPMVNALDEYERTVAEENELLKSEEKNRTKFDKLVNLLANEKRLFQINMQEQTALLAELKDLREDTITENKVKKNYIEHWENARIEQNNYRLDKQEDHFLSIINQAKLKTDRETRIAAEIKAYITETKTEYEEEIQVWMEKYDHEIELRDTEIVVLKTKRLDQYNTLQALSKLYNQRKLEMNAYLAVKEQRRLEALHKKKLDKAATKIQAWWRGIMVRKGFGAWRKKKGKDKDKKKGKKK